MISLLLALLVLLGAADRSNSLCCSFSVGCEQETMCNPTTRWSLLLCRLMYSLIIRVAVRESNEVKYNIKQTDRAGREQ